MTSLSGLVLLSLLAGLVSGCGGCGKDEDGPRILSFTVDPESIVLGGEATLSWETENAVSIEIVDHDGTSIDIGEAGVEDGSVGVSPEADTTYTLTAIGEDGTEPAAADVTLVVIDTEGPVVVSFAADPSEIDPGEEAVLSWETIGGETVEIVDGDGTVLDLGDVDVDADSHVVSPSKTTTYTLTVHGPDGEASADATVTVLGVATIVSFTADPHDAVLSGTDVTLSWETVGALAVTLFADGEQILTTDTDLDGSYVATVEFSTEFVLVATGDYDSEDEATLVVPVIPVILTFDADPSLIRPGDPVTFMWTTSGAESVRLTGPDGIDYAATGEDAIDGSHTTNVNEGGTFTLTAEGGDLDDFDTLEIEITHAPRIVSLSANPDEVTEGGVVTIAWEVEGAVSLSMEIDGVGEVDLEGKQVSGDEVDVTLLAPGTVAATLTATNDDGDSVATTTIEVVAIPSILSFSAIPARVSDGEVVTLSWQTEHAHSIRIEKEGADLGVDAGTLSGSTTDTVDTESSYVLFALNRLGHEVESEPLIVEIGAPEIVSFTAALGHVQPGGDIELSWVVMGGNDLIVRLEGDVVCETQDVVEIASGGCVTIAPVDPRDYALELEVSNDAGSDTAVLKVYVSDGPIITSFEVSDEIITLGESFEVSWIITDDASGQTPSLSYTVDGESHDVPPTFDPNQDSGWFTPGELGLVEYTFTASTQGTTPAVVEWQVLVVAAPKIVFFEADPDFFDTDGGTQTPESTLSWAVEDATSLHLYELDADGDPLDPPLLEETDLDPEQTSEGEFGIGPEETTRYRLTAYNAAGYEVVAHARLIVDGARVVSFTGECPDGNVGQSLETIAGETVTLAWETDRADSVSLSPMSGFVDISETGTPFFMDTAWGDRHFDLDLDFTFPYYGIDRDRVRIGLFALVSFQFTESFTWLVGEFPGGGNVRSPMMAAFWDFIRPKDTESDFAFYHFGSDSHGEYLRIQWHDFEFGYDTDNPASLSVQIVLRDSGVFEFHYGEMMGVNDRAEGSEASIGFDDDNGAEGMSVSYAQAYPGGLAHRGFVFTPTATGYEMSEWAASELPLDGTLDVQPFSDTVYRLTAHSDEGDDWETVEVVVHPAVGAPSVAFEPPEGKDEVEVGDDFEITWSVPNAHRVQVLDWNDAVLCDEVGDPTDLQTGTCQVTAPATADAYTYTVVATGAFERDQQEGEVEVLVLEELRIISFYAEGVPEDEPVHISIGESVTVVWEAVGATGASLFRGTEPVHIAALDPNQDSRLVPDIGQTVVITFIIEDDAGRTRSSGFEVYVDAPRLHDFTVDGEDYVVVAAGETVTLEWDATEDAEKTLDPAAVAVDISSQVAFEDISGSGTSFNLPYSTTTGNYDIVFDDYLSGFRFPYYDEERDFVRVHTFGSVSFQEDYGLSWSNTPFPGGSNVRSPQISVFWDDIRQKNDDSAFYDFGSDADGDYLRIQWDDFESYYSTHNPSNMTFQLLLRDSGVFEMHYLTMDGPTDRVDASAATIGFDNDDGDVGFQLTHNQAIAGGLDGRAWRYEIIDFSDDSGSVEVRVTETTTFEMCVSGSGYIECKEVTVVVIGEGDIMVNELMPYPDSSLGLDGQWIEIYNTSGFDLDLEGWVVAVDGDTHEVAESIVIEAAGHAVLGRDGDSGGNGGYEPDYVYGEDLRMLQEGSTIRITFQGLEVDTFTYHEDDWTITEGVSLSLHPSRLTGDPADNEDPVFWCEPTSTFGTAGQYGSPGEPNDDLDCGWYVGTLSYTSTPALAIPDGDPAGVTDVQSVSEYCLVTGVNLDIDITHTWIGDLIVELVGPDGTTVRLHNRSGSSLDDLVGNYPDSPPHGIQDGSLDVFQGIDPLGDWTLFVSDSITPDAGTLNSWTLNIECG